MQTIDALFVDQFGWVYSLQNKIECFEENGEMAPVKWYRCTPHADPTIVNVFNGKYVIHIRYTENQNEKV